MRCFIAIDLTDSLKSNLHANIVNTSSASDILKIPPYENIHLTMRFLGDISEAIADKVFSKLQALSGRYDRFTLQVYGTGVFPHPSRPTVFWAGIKTSDELTILHRDLQNALATIGFEAENRPFTPHITVARTKNPKDARASARQWLALSDIQWGSFDVCDLTFYQSILTPSHAVYKRLKSFRLAKDA